MPRTVFHQTCADFVALLATGDVPAALQLLPARPSRGWRTALERALALADSDGAPTVRGKLRRTLQARLRQLPATLYNPSAPCTCTGCGWVGTGEDFGARWLGTRRTVDPDEWEDMADTVLESATEATYNRVLGSLRREPDGTWTAEVPTVQNACKACRRESRR